jgi:hypothetical protein
LAAVPSRRELPPARPELCTRFADVGVARRATHIGTLLADGSGVEMHADGRFIVTQRVTVEDVVRWRSELSATLTGGDDPETRRHVRWRFAEEDDAERHERTLREWERVGALLTVVERPGEVAVIDEDALLARALQ